MDITIKIQNIEEKYRNIQDIEKRGGNVDILNMEEGLDLKMKKKQQVYLGEKRKLKSRCC